MNVIEFIQDNLKAVIITTAIIVAITTISILIWMATTTDACYSTISSKSWTRTTEVQEYRWVEDSNTSRMFYPTAPTGSRNVNHHHWVTYDHHPRQTHTETYYTGSGENKKSHTRTVTDREAWDERIDYYRTSYEIQRWVYDRTLTATGDQTAEPVFPTFTEDTTHRVSQRTENYVYKFFVSRLKETKEFTSKDYNLYKKLTLQDEFIVNINKFGFILSVKEPS